MQRGLTPLAFPPKIGYSLSMIEKVLKFIEKYHMIVKGDKVIAGISGGADSVFLLFVLLELQKRLGIDIVSVHINHGIRGAAADADEQFVRELCVRHGVESVVYHENVELIAKNRKQSLEEAGRTVRREAFEKALLKYGGTKIAMAHHQNDNAETLLMNLARGAGLKGLGGIRPVNGKVIRPLLCLSRQEIEVYLQEKGCSYCLDETNEGDEYTRNRIRHMVIPVLEEQVNKKAVRHMNEAMERILEQQEYMEVQTDEAFGKCVGLTSGGMLKIQKKEFERQHPAIQKQLVLRCLAEISGSERNISQIHVKAVLSLFRMQCGKRRDLPYGVSAVRNYEGIVLKKSREGKAENREGPDAGFSPRWLNIPGVTDIPERNLKIHCRILENTEGFSVKHVPQKNYTKWFDYDIIKNSLIVRTRQSKDSIVIDRAGKRQKLKSYFINEKIPAEERSKLLLIADSEQIIWILGYRMSSACQITEQTNRVLEIKVTEDKGYVRED